MKKVVLFGTALFALLIISLLSLIENSYVKKSEALSKMEKKSDVVELKMGHNMQQNSALHRAAVNFANKVEKKTGGMVKITVYPKQELGNDYQMIELARSGEIDILLTPTAKMSVTVPSMQYVDLPFIFPSREDAYALLDGSVGDMLLKELNEIDLLGVTFWENGFKNFTSNRPLLKIEDFKNLKIRVMKSQIIEEQFLSLKAKPISIEFSETKKALQDGVVNAQENPLIAIVGMEFYKVQSDVTISEHAYLAYIMSFSKKSISALPVDFQNILIQTAKTMTPLQREDAKKDEKIAFDVIKEAGLNIHKLSFSERKRLEQATEHIIHKYEDVIGSHIISKTQEYLYKKYPTQNSVAIGIDADLSMGAKGAGLAIKRGVELAAQEINNRGGILGKKVYVVAKDHQGVSTQARENIKEFIADKNIIAVIGGKHSAIISSYIEDIHDNKLIYFSPWAASTGITENGYAENYIFRVSLNDRYATKYLAQETLKYSSNPAIVIENSIWGKGALKNINQYFVSKGLKKQDGIIINRGEENFEKVFNTIGMGNYDSIIMILNSQEAIKFVQSIGKNSVKIPIVSHWGMVGDSFYRANKEYLSNMDLRFIQTFSLVNSKDEEAKKLAKNYLKIYAKTSENTINAITGVVQAYDSVMLLADAIQRCKSFDSNKVKESLENIDIHNGVIKTYKRPFDKINHDALNEKDFLMAKFDNSGNVVPIKK